MQPQTAPQAFTPYQPPITPGGFESTPVAIAAAPEASTPAGAPVMTQVTYFRHANFGARFVALLLDFLILGVLESALVAVMYTVMIGCGYLLGDLGGMLIMGLLAWVVTPALGLAVAVIYFLKGETGLDQGTIGRRVLGIKVVTLEGKTISAGQSVGRLFSRVLSSLFFCLGYFLALFTEKKQALHDMIAGTIVVQR